MTSHGKDRSTEPPALAPLPREVPALKDNPTTAQKAELGKQLFFDPRLSGENTMSCATCHVPKKAFGDGQIRAQGHRGKKLSRNTPSLLNSAYAARYHWDGKVKTLEEQALLPIQSHDEMNQALDELENELGSVGVYAEQFHKVFGTKVTRDGIAKALACFQRTLVTKPSPFDRFLAGDKSALSESAQRGLELFAGDAGCVRCHRGPLLGDGEFYRLGVSFQDDGRAAVTKNEIDKGKFRTPSLRNVSQTAPYMHDGSLKTLEEVVTFYYRAVPTTAVEGLPLDIEPLVSRSFSEIADVVAFLESLTGEPPKITPPILP